MRPALALLALLCGCTPSRNFPYMDIVDQRTFWPHTEAPDASRVHDLPPLPLATIRFGAGDPDYQSALASAVEQARSRKPDVEFNVMTALPPGAVPDATDQREATDVAHAIAEQSIPTDRIHVGTVEDEGAPKREIRVYVR